MNHRLIRLFELLPPAIRLRVHLLGHLQAVITRIGQADDLLESGGTGGLEVHPGIEIPDGLMDR